MPLKPVFTWLLGIVQDTRGRQLSYIPGLQRIFRVSLISVNMNFKNNNGRNNTGSDQSLKEVTMVNDFVEGKPRSFEVIFEHFHRPLYCHVLRFVKSPELAGDIVQDVFIKLLENRRSINPEYSLKAYLYTIAKNHLLNILRRASCEERIKREIIAHTQLSRNQEDEIIYNDFEQFAKKAIESLPPQRKLVFKMFKDEGKDHHQIASALGISRNTVRDHLTKATRFVRGYIKIHTGIISILLVFFLVD